MTYAEFFYEIKSRFMGADVSDIHEHLAFQFNVEDPDCGGIFYVEVKEGQASYLPDTVFRREHWNIYRYKTISHKMKFAAQCG